MAMHDDDRPWLLPVPGRPEPERFGAGSASGYQYSTALGELIADLYVTEDRGGLWAIHHAMPERIPPPAIVRAWCQQFPAFGLVMREAERLRAERLMEQSLVIADTEPDVRRATLQIATRQAFAEKLDRARYGKGDAPHHAPAQLAGQNVQPLAHGLSDETLAQIAAQAVENAGGDGAGGQGPR